MPYWLELTIFTVCSGIIVGRFVRVFKPLGEEVVLLFVFTCVWPFILLARRILGRKEL